jgi:hypothetical protein
MVTDADFAELHRQIADLWARLTKTNDARTREDLIVMLGMCEAKLKAAWDTRDHILRQWGEVTSPAA